MHYNRAALQLAEQIARQSAVRDRQLSLSDEDWKNVSLSLISGSPVSFIQPIQKPLYRYRPSLDEHQHPFQLDSSAPTVPLRDFVMQEARYAMLARTDPERSAELISVAQAAVDERWHYYEQLAGVERSIPHTDAPVNAVARSQP